MARYQLKDSWYTPNELSEMSGIPPHTIRDRLRRGYTVEEAVKLIPTHESVKEFVAASYWGDWIGLPMSELYKIYWNWCIANRYNVLQIQGFSRQVLKMFPNLKTVPNRVGGKCMRIIREK